MKTNNINTVLEIVLKINK